MKQIFHTLPNLNITMGAVVAAVQTLKGREQHSHVAAVAGRNAGWRNAGGRDADGRNAAGSNAERRKAVGRQHQVSQAGEDWSWKTMANLGRYCPGAGDDSWMAKRWQG